MIFRFFLFLLILAIICTSALVLISYIFNIDLIYQIFKVEFWKNRRDKKILKKIKKLK